MSGDVPAAQVAVMRGGIRSGYAVQFSGDPPSRIVLSRSGRNYLPNGPPVEDEIVYEYVGRGDHGEAIYRPDKTTRRDRR